jgi:hypothetical protein
MWIQEKHPYFRMEIFKRNYYGKKIGSFGTEKGMGNF